MSLFPLVAGRVGVNIGAPTAADQYSNGLRLVADNTAVYTALAGGDEYSSGLLLTATGALLTIDATAGLPAGTQYSNGLPLSGGALCTSTGPIATYSNGIPFTANGAVAA